MDVTATVPCLPGLFVAGVFSAALRYSISAGAATFLNYLVTLSHNLESCRLLRYSTERGEGTTRNKQKSCSIRVESCQTSTLYACFISSDQFFLYTLYFHRLIHLGQNYFLEIMSGIWNVESHTHL
jgi:hypothetical protein